MLQRQTFDTVLGGSDGRCRPNLLSRAGSLSAVIVFFCSGALVQCFAERPEIAEDRASSKLAAHSASDADVTQWVKELSNDSFVVRQAAASKLLSAGMAAREPLSALADGPDPEARASARRLIALIDEAEFRRRLEAFASDVDGKQGTTLPGWDAFQKLVGGDSGARSLYVEMYRQEGSLIAAAFGSPRRSPTELLESRLARLNVMQPGMGDRFGGTSLASSATLLFLGSLSDADVSYGTAMIVEALLLRPPVAEVLRSGDKPQLPLRRLVVAWVLHCPTKSEEVLARRLEVITVYGLKEALSLPLAVATADPPYHRAQPMTRAGSALIVGQLGSADEIDKLEPLLNDATVCFGPQMQIQGQLAGVVQVRDAALVALLQITNQRPAEYGYINAQLQPLRLYQLRTLFQLDDQHRGEAIAKWRQWRAEQKATGKPSKTS